MVDAGEATGGWGRTWPPRIIAERGTCWHAPENSLRAIRGAVAAGSDAIAIDIMRCGTGEVIACFERTLVKFSPGCWDDVAATPFETLRAIDLGDGERIPLLAEALAAIPAERLIDLRLRAVSRSHTERWELAVIVIATAARARRLHRVLVSSEDSAALAPFADAGVATALVMPSMSARVVSAAPSHPRIVRLELRSVGVSVMRHWHACNTAVEVWPANTRAELALAWSLGVDGVLTNDPVAARETFDEMQSRCA